MESKPKMVLEFVRYIARTLAIDLTWPIAFAAALWLSTRSLAPAARDAVVLRSLGLALLCTWLDLRALRRRVDSLEGNDDLTQWVKERVRRNRERGKAGR